MATSEVSTEPLADDRTIEWDAACFLKVLEEFYNDYPALRGRMSVDRYLETCLLLGRDFCLPNAKVVDVGAWPGILAGCLARVGFKVTAVDKDPQRPYEWSQQSLLHGCNRFVGDTANSVAALCQREDVEVVSADIERVPLPIESNSADVVLLTEVIEHLWHDPIFALSEINRVLKQDTGILVLSTPNFICLRNRVNFLFGRISAVIEHPFVSFLKLRRVGHLGHCRLYAPDELLTMLKLLGFECKTTYAQYKSDEGQYVAASHASATSACPERGQTRSLVRKLFRSPKNYWSAVCATAIDILERMVPRFRPQIYVVARKVADADFDRNCPHETQRLILSNALAG